MKISLITGHKADYLIRKETPELKKGFKVFLTLAAIGSFIGFILAYFCKSSTKQDMESLENEETDFTEDFSLDGDLKPVSDRGYVSLTKETQEGNWFTKLFTISPQYQTALLFRFTGSAGLFSTLFIYFGSLNELFSETILLNTGYSAVESFASMQKYPFLTNWKLS